MTERITQVTVKRAQTPDAKIEAFVNNTEVGARVGLREFVDLLAAEVDNPALIMTQKQLRVRLQAASEKVLVLMKGATKYVA